MKDQYARLVRGVLYPANIITGKTNAVSAKSLFAFNNTPTPG